MRLLRVIKNSDKISLHLSNFKQSDILEMKTTILQSDILRGDYPCIHFLANTEKQERFVFKNLQI